MTETRPGKAAAVQSRARPSSSGSKKKKTSNSWATPEGHMIVASSCMLIGQGMTSQVLCDVKEHAHNNDCINAV